MFDSVQKYKKPLEDTERDHASNTLVQVFGSDIMKTRLKNEIVDKYKDCLSQELSTKSALIEAFELELIPGEAWHSSKLSKQPARKQSFKKNAAIEEFVQKALVAGIIEPSNASSWSQVLLTPKPNGKWRFCIDFRALNENTKSMGWPIPVIQQILQRIGDKEPQYFAVLDLTQGYYQASISEAAKDLTAFRTPRGLYRWRRLPMGLKGAPSWFQQQMSTKVFAGLLYNICEVYLDDIIVFGKTEDEFINNLTTIFERLKEFNITINPEKCRIGLSEVEYIGHVINRHGVTFSDNKKNEVLHFTKPKTHRELKSFLGLASYFRAHVKKYIDMATPLNRTITPYKKNRIIDWNTQLDECFNALRIAVNTCPQLYFMNNNTAECPVFLHTDASQYGIGAYLFQMVDGVERPIYFLSKTLNKTELKWSTIEKEQYAIFYALTKLEHYLRDVHFVLKTDHKNLVLLNTDPREKVQRWRLAIQYYDFDIEYIKGEDNVVADGFSRLCQGEIDKSVESEIINYFSETTQIKFNGENLNMTERLNVVIVKRELRSMKVKAIHIDKITKNITIDKQAIISLTSSARNQIKLVHNDVIGHLGVEKTVQKLQDTNQRWKHMRKNVEKYIKQCSCCQKMSQLKPHIITQPFTLASYSVMDRISIDTIGPFPENESGYQFIIVLIDNFSRFVTLIPVKSTTALEAAQAILTWLGNFGIPSQIISDNGTQFANETVAQLLDILGVEHVRIHPYSHQENSIVERANKEVNRHLRAIVFHRKIKSQWYKFLPLVQRIMNAQVHKSLGVSPAQIVFGGSINLDRGLIPTTLSKINPVTDMTEYVTDLIQAQGDIIKIAQENQLAQDDYHIAKGEGISITEFPINSYVLVNYENDEHKPPTKLHTHLMGPFRIVNFNTNKTVYTVQDLVTNKLKDFHVKLLHQFNYDPDITNPDDVALHDEDYHKIDSVEAHRWKDKHHTASKLQLFIKWDNEVNPKWQNWSIDLARNETVHEYLLANKLSRFIPIRYKYDKNHPKYQEEKLRKFKLQQQNISRKRKRHSS